MLFQTHSLFRNRTMLDEMFPRNASKFAIFLEYEKENPCIFFVKYSHKQCVRNPGN